MKYIMHLVQYSIKNMFIAYTNIKIIDVLNLSTRFLCKQV